ncbi:biotin--[acetyl-CoA-carboxylase] ligase [Arcanobacterium hippocoleae]
MEQSNHFELLSRDCDSLTYFESLTSTQDFFQQNWREMPQFSVCIADFQERGRGRYQRHWQAPKQTSLLMSVLIPLDSNIDYGWATFAGALAAREACAKILPAQKILLKWPNDVVSMQGQKIGGVLGEVLGERDGMLFGAIGVGINILQAKNELLATATSLRMLDSSLQGEFKIVREALAVLFLNELKQNLQLQKTDVLSKMSLHCIDIGKVRNLQTRIGKISGTVRGIGANGELILGNHLITPDQMAQNALLEPDFVTKK